MARALWSLLLLLAASGGCATPAHPTSSAPDHPAGPDDALLSGPLWDYGPLPDRCDPSHAQAPAVSSWLHPAFNGTAREVAGRLAHAVGDPLTDARGVRTSRLGDPGITFRTQSGTIHVTDPDHDGPTVMYENPGLGNWDQARLRDAVDRLLAQMPVNLTDLASDGFHLHAVATAGPHPDDALGQAVLLGTTGDVHLVVWPWHLQDAQARIPEERAVAIAQEYQACWENALGLHVAQRPTHVHERAWNGTWAYAVQQRAQNLTYGCHDPGAPVLVDSVTGFVVGHDWDGCYSLPAGKFNETGLRSQPIPYDCPGKPEDPCVSEHP